LKKLDGHVHQVRRPECSVHSDFCSENNTPYVSECNRSNQLLNVLDKGSKTYLEITTRKDAPNSCKHRSDSGFRCCQYVNTNKGICKSNSRRDDSPAFLNVEKDIDVVQQHDDIPVPPIKSKKNKNKKVEEFDPFDMPMNKQSTKTSSESSPYNEHLDVSDKYVNHESSLYHSNPFDKRETILGKTTINDAPKSE